MDGGRGYLGFVVCVLWAATKKGRQLWGRKVHTINKIVATPMHFRMKSQFQVMMARWTLISPKEKSSCRHVLLFITSKPLDWTKDFVPYLHLLGYRMH